LEEAIKDGQSYLESNPDAEKDEYDEKRKEIEGICDPIIKGGMDANKGGEEEEE
jgi:heat shock protein 5